MTATIRETNVFTDLFLCIFGKLNTITDPVGKSKWVYSAFPEAIIDKEESYPLITITSADVSYTPLTFRNLKRGPVRYEIDVYTTVAKQLDSVSSSVAAKMESEEGNFAISGVTVMRLINTIYSHFERNGLRVHNKKMYYEFDFGWF